MVRHSNHVRKGLYANVLAPMTKRSGHPAWFECLTMTALFFLRRALQFFPHHKIIHPVIANRYILFIGNHKPHLFIKCFGFVMAVYI